MKLDPPTVLIVEDDAGHRRLIEKNLLRENPACSIRSFADGQAVLDYFGQLPENDPAEKSSSLFLVLDLRLPKLDGIEVLKRIKRDPRLRKIPVSILSTSDNPEEIETCYTTGCSYYFVKPFEYDKFCEVVSELGRLSQMARLPRVAGVR